MKKSIWVNTIVNDEENFIWFSIMSVIDYVDKILVWDSGSDDKTVMIIKEIKKIKGGKIDFKEIGKVDNEKLTKMRDEQLRSSHCDWILILDGDEIWWEDSIRKVIYEINNKGDQIDGIVVPMIMSVGDIYHFQEEEAGRYEILGHKGHYNLRAIRRNIENLHVDYTYPKEGYLDASNKLIQESEKTIILNTPYLHVSHLRRSSSANKNNKFKHELGERHKKDFKYPEILYKRYPKIVPSPWVSMSRSYIFKSAILTPLRKIKRRIII